MSSAQYTLETKSTEAMSPRWPGSTVLHDDKLSLVYNKYKTTAPSPTDSVSVNLVFLHGTGMNKQVWHYYVQRLYELASAGGWFLNCVLAIDNVGHGDSAVLNDGKLGWCFKWEEGAKDLIKVVKEEQATTGDFISSPWSKNILVGHSLGGFGVVMAGFYEPSLFDSVMPIEGVLYGESEHEEKFRRVMKKLENFIIDRFDTKEEFDDYFTKFFIYKNFHPQILKEFMESELRVFVDPKTGNKTYGTKASRQAQLTTYLCSVLSFQVGMSIYSQLTVPVCHIAGLAGKWNPPGTSEFVRSHVPAHLITAIDIKDGEHLVIGEKPDELIDIINDYVKKRVVEAKKLIPKVLDVKYNRDRQKIMEAQSEILESGDVESASVIGAKL